LIFDKGPFFSGLKKYILEMKCGTYLLAFISFPLLSKFYSIGHILRLSETYQLTLPFVVRGMTRQTLRGNVKSTVRARISHKRGRGNCEKMGLIGYRVSKKEAQFPPE
jgi:hypothetical protein